AARPGQSLTVAVRLRLGRRGRRPHVLRPADRQTRRERAGPRDRHRRFPRRTGRPQDRGPEDQRTGAALRAGGRPVRIGPVRHGAAREVGFRSVTWATRPFGTRSEAPRPVSPSTGRSGGTPSPTT